MTPLKIQNFFISTSPIEGSQTHSGPGLSIKSTEVAECFLQFDQRVLFERRERAPRRIGSPLRCLILHAPWQLVLFD